MEKIHENIHNKLNYFLQSNKIPHIIFHGSSGTGKKTIVYDFINKIYKGNKYNIKTNVMFVNCAHGKGIKFIREELKFFAKTNIQANSGVLFKTIILMNAEFLTIDAQSALRRCIELFSYNTRFFIIVENKNKLLNPILSRFCEIFVPEYVENNKVLNLHQYNLNKKMDLKEHELEKQEYLATKIVEPVEPNNELINHIHFVEMCTELYENGISCLDVLKFVETCGWWKKEDVVYFHIVFSKVKIEFRCEKLLMLFMFDLFYRGTYGSPYDPLPHDVTSNVTRDVTS